VKATLVPIVVALAGCAVSDSLVSTSEQRYHNETQGYAVDQPSGWSPAIVRGSAQFSPGAADKQRHTIVVRSATKPREMIEGQPTTTEQLVAATERVLRGLPKAKLGDRAPIVGAELPGTRFTVTFVPRGQTKSYRRDHAVLVGTKRIFHVFYTSPVNEPVDEAAFKAMVTSLTEEG
jgi:hypothetical protein